MAVVSLRLLTHAGGLIVTHLGLMNAPWIAALAVLGALGLTVLSGRLDRRGATRHERLAAAAKVLA